MKPFFKIAFAVCILQCVFFLKAYAIGTTYDWTGATDGNWMTPGNWNVGGTPQTTNYPGISSSDIAQIGVSNSFTNQPTISSAVSFGTLIIGTKTSSVTLTINAAVIVNSDFTQKNDGSGTGETTSITGTGSIYCANFYLGDSTKPPTPLISLANTTYKTILNFSLSGMTVGQNLVLTTTSTTATLNALYPASNVNNPIFNLNSGWVSVGGAIQTVDANDVNLSAFTIPLVASYSAISSSAQFLMNPASGNSSIVYFTGSNPLSLDGNAGYVDFYGTAGGTSQVNYSGSVDQEVYTTSCAYSAAGTRQYANGLDRSPSIYQDLVLSGSQTKKADANNLTIGGNLTLSVSSTTVADFSTNSPVVVISGIYTANIGTTLNLGGTGTMSVGCPVCTSTNAGTLNQASSGNITFAGPLSNQATGAISQSGSGAINLSSYLNNAGSYTQTSGSTGGMTISGNLTNSGIITQTSGAISAGGNLSNSGTLTLGTSNLIIGGNYNNTGTYTQGTGTTIFNGSSAETLQDGSSGGTNFNNVTFIGGGSKTMSSGVFSVSTTGILTMGSSTSLAAGGNLTLKSDASGSAAVAAIPSGCSITGTVNVQRYLPGIRGWALLSSPVNAGTVTTGSNTVSVYDLNFLLNSTWVSGTGFTTSGFSKNGNPSLFLYRENFHGVGAGYAQSNYRAVVSMSTTTPLVYTTLDGNCSVPIGNGYELYFRGGTGTPTPFTNGTVAYPATLTTAGKLNQGAIPFTHWNTPGSQGLMFTTISGSASIEGFNLVGNPYACTIDLSTYSSGGITMSSNVSTSVYEYNSQKGTYGVYILGSAIPPTNNASQYIASGQGFFLQAASAPATLTFNESCKNPGQQNTGSNLLLSKGAVPTTVPQYLRLHMALDSVYSDETIISFNSQAKSSYVFNEDALYMPGSGKASLASLSSDNKLMTINARPLAPRGDTIKLKVNAANGSYSIGVNAINGIPQLYRIWLFDAYKKDSVDLRHASIYQFDVNRADTNTYGVNRFTVIINQDPAYAYHLLSFTATRLGNSSNVETHWQAANEENYTNFTVERSTDGGKTFTVVGGMWGSGAGNYSLMDKNMQMGTFLYRLRSEDINNTISYSDTATVVITNKGNTGNISVYPNPAASVLNLDILERTHDGITYGIVVSNSSGFIVKRATSSRASWQANVNDLMPGTYLIRVTNNKTQSFVGESKFVKL